MNQEAINRFFPTVTREQYSDIVHNKVAEKDKDVLRQAKKFLMHTAHREDSLLVMKDMPVTYTTVCFMKYVTSWHMIEKTGMKLENSSQLYVNDITIFLQALIELDFDKHCKNVWKILNIMRNILPEHSNKNYLYIKYLGVKND